MSHISKSPACQDQYLKRDILELDAWTKERKEKKKSQKREVLYDPAKCKAAYSLVSIISTVRLVFQGFDFQIVQYV